MKFRMYFDPEPEDELDPKPFREAIERFMTKHGFVLKDRLRTYDYYQQTLKRSKAPSAPSGLVTKQDAKKSP